VRCSASSFVDFESWGLSWRELFWGLDFAGSFLCVSFYVSAVPNGEAPLGDKKGQLRKEE
jgi:hypothetical protein